MAHQPSRDELRARLEAERATAIEQLQRLRISPELEEGSRDDASAIVEEGDAAQASERRDMDFARRERLAERINQLTDALARLEQGRYGVCEVCGNPIEPQRLAALPEARTCLRCQEAMEASGRQPEAA